MKTVSKFKNIIFYKQRATLISGCSKKEELCCAIVTRGRILAFVECARSGSIEGSTNRLYPVIMHSPIIVLPTL